MLFYLSNHRFFTAFILSILIHSLLIVGMFITGISVKPDIQPIDNDEIVMVIENNLDDIEKEKTKENPDLDRNISQPVQKPKFHEGPKIMACEKLQEYESLLMTNASPEECQNQLEKIMNDYQSLDEKSRKYFRKILRKKEEAVSLNINFLHLYVFKSGAQTFYKYREYKEYIRKKESGVPEILFYIPENNRLPGVYKPPVKIEQPFPDKQMKEIEDLLDRMAKNKSCYQNLLKIMKTVEYDMYSGKIRE